MESTTLTHLFATVTPEHKGRHANFKTALRLAFAARQHIRDAGGDPSNHTAVEFLPAVEDFCTRWELDFEDVGADFLIRWGEIGEPGRACFIAVLERLDAELWRVELPGGCHLEDLRRLGTTCHYLAAENGRFFLSSRKAAEVIGKGRTVGALRMKALIAIGFLALVKPAYFDAETGTRYCAEYGLAGAAVSPDRTHTQYTNSKPTPHTHAHEDVSTLEDEAVPAKPGGGISIPLKPPPVEAELMAAAVNRVFEPAPTKAEPPPPPVAKHPNPEPWNKAPRELRAIFHACLEGQPNLPMADNFDSAKRAWQGRPEYAFVMSWLKAKRTHKGASKAKYCAAMAGVVWAHLEPGEAITSKGRRQIIEAFEVSGSESARDAVVGLLCNSEGVRSRVAVLRSRVARQPVKAVA